MREFHAKSAQLESVKGERIALQHEVSDLKNRIDHLDVDLAGMRELQKRTAAALEGMNELDRARLVESCIPKA